MTHRRGFARRMTALAAAAAWLVAGNASAFLDTGTLLTNAASATYMGGGQGTSVTYSATAKILVANPAVYLWKDVTPTYMAVAGGANVTYTICFSNGGANTAFNVTIFDHLPQNTVWQTAGYSAWYVDLTNTGRDFSGTPPNGAAAFSAGAPPPWGALPADGTAVAAGYLQWVVPSLGLGKSGCIVFVVKLQ